MGFIYSKPLSVEGVFSKFDTNRDGTISHEEYEASQPMDIFTSFKVKVGMTLQEFESANIDAYAYYEKNATEKYKQQQKEIQQWLKQEQTSLQELQEIELKELDKKDQEFALEKEKKEQELQIFNRRQQTKREIKDKINKMTAVEIMQEAEKRQIPTDMPFPSVKAALYFDFLVTEMY